MQGWEHCCPGFSHGPGWQIVIHLCRPQDMGLLHDKPHEISLTWHGTAFRNSCLPWHHLWVRTVQGGQVISLWQLCNTSCPQECWREQGLSHTGLRVPHGTGGYITEDPHSQYNSSKLLRQQGWHLPILKYIILL